MVIDLKFVPTGKSLEVVNPVAPAGKTRSSPVEGSTSQLEELFQKKSAAPVHVRTAGTIRTSSASYLGNTLCRRTFPRRARKRGVSSTWPRPRLNCANMGGFPRRHLV